MSDVIESGVVTDFVKKLLGLDGKALKRWGLDIEDEQPVKDNEGNDIGSLYTVTTAQGHKLHVKLLETAHRSNLYDMYVVSDNDKKHAYPHIQKDDMGDKLGEFISDAYDEADSVDTKEEGGKDFDVDDENFDTGVNSSKKLQVKLSKIQATGEIVYHGIYANYAVDDVYEDIEAITCDEEFLEELSDEPAIYEIVQDDEDYNVYPVEELNEMDSTSEVIKAQYYAIFKLQSLRHDLAADFGELDLDAAIELIQNNMNFIVRSKLGLQLDVIDTLKAIDLDALLEDPSDASWVIESYASALELYKCNYPDEIQQLFNEWLLTLRYFM